MDQPRIEQARKLVTEIPGPRSRDLWERRTRAIPAGVGTTLPIFVERAYGGIVEDVDGNRLIDLGAGIAVVNVGHAHPAVAAAIAEQAAKFVHTCFQVTPYDGYVEVCEQLNERTPGTHEKRSFLVNSGAEGVENAVKIARAATGRPAIIAFDQAFHGRTLLALSLTAKVVPYKRSFGPYAPEVYRAPYSYPYRGAGGLAESIAWIEASVDASQVACVVVEPIAGEGGFVVPEPGWFAGIAQWCRANGVVFVADEVQTGFGRTGAWFASEHEDVVPDVVVTAKGLGGGMPIAGVTGRSEIMDAVHVGGLGSTFGGNPVSCAAALAAIDVIEKEELVDRALHLGERMLARLTALQRETTGVGDVRGRGAMVAMELVHDDGTPDAERAKQICASCHEQGVIVLTAGTMGNVVRLLPPLVLDEALLDQGLDALDAAVRG
ncbi:MAG: 4-aminobutyrate aminotransferase / (S)-3-amino-2-methylpropionate transaminase / 5-aminovalerate [Actinomycetota bacterium]|jgi:4-aminobutyrate aminotransferase/(S)-3-amino-2-methylpropionate transaminase|nr:4-aminobutyrate aminotransferase / (S)-3-amino-2-methylpropionate transaminase / 5-aminovalerate [Actinomycetota bacterium]